MLKHGLLSIALFLSFLCSNTFATPNQETKAAVSFLRSSFAEQDRLFIRFLSTYAVKPEQRQNVVLASTFVMHSLIGPDDSKTGNRGSYHPLAKIVNNEYVPYKLVPGTKTLWWFDLRDFNWTIEAWETVSNQDGYFVEPIVDHNLNALLRLDTGNAIVRADWFVLHATDTSIQVDRNKPVLYDALLYAKTRVPRDGREWGAAWGFDPPEQRFGQEYSVVTTSSNVISRTGNRLLKGNRTTWGYGYQTFDVVSQEGDKDYIEELFNHEGDVPNSDGGEMIGTNVVGLQVYGIRDKNFKLIHVADASLVRNNHDPLNDSRVRVGLSCMDCHSHGTIPSANAIKAYFDKGGKIAAKNKNAALKIKALLLDGRFEEQITNNQESFTQALNKTNGLTPTENNKALIETVVEYSKPVNIEQASFECGVTPEIFKSKLQGRVSGRLAMLLTTNEPIPRSIWESPTIKGVPSPFQQAMINLYGLKFEEPVQKVIDIGDYQITTPVNLIPPNTSFRDDGTPSKVYNILLEAGQTVRAEDVFTHTTQGQFLGITVKGTFGWIPTRNAKRIR